MLGHVTNRLSVFRLCFGLSLRCFACCSTTSTCFYTVTSTFTLRFRILRCTPLLKVLAICLSKWASHRAHFGAPLYSLWIQRNCLDCLSRVLSCTFWAWIIYAAICHSFRWPREPVKRCTWSNDIGGANLASARTPPLENTTFVSELLEYCCIWIAFMLQPRVVLLCLVVAVFCCCCVWAWDSLVHPQAPLTVASVTNSVVPEAAIVACARAGRDA